MSTYNNLLEGNKNWVEEQLKKDKNYFKNLAKGQTPQFLFIGCSDSRVPPNEITQSDPGQMFIHQNIANLVINTDINFASVLHYAVEVLHVKDIIVCGHYECGGIKTAMSNLDIDIINKWLRTIKEVYQNHIEELEAIKDIKQRENRLVELNVIDQVINLAKTSVVQKAWKKRELKIHGWVIDLHTGYFKDLNVMVDEIKDLPEIFRFDLD